MSRYSSRISLSDRLANAASEIGGKLLMTNNRVVNNVRKVLEARDIGLLRPETYRFITLHMGFIAHYDLGGFKAEYADLRRFCRKLETSEYSDLTIYNLQRAARVEELGLSSPEVPTTNQDTANTMRAIVLLAREYEEQIDKVFAAYERDREVEEASRLAEKHGYVLVRQWNPEPARARS